MNKQITESIKYIGVDDTDIDLFESQYVVPNGVSYNSYIIIDERVAIMDSVDERKSEEWLENVENTLQGRTPDYLIVQHMEPDHAGSIHLIAERYPAMQIVASERATQMLPQFFHETEFEHRTIAVRRATPSRSAVTPCSSLWPQWYIGPR